jgi:hypothetical protein
MIGADTTFLVQLEIVEAPEHHAAHKLLWDKILLFLDWMEKHQLGRKRFLDTELAATFWSAGIREIFSSNPGDFSMLGFTVVVPRS